MTPDQADFEEDPPRQPADFLLMIHNPLEEDPDPRGELPTAAYSTLASDEAGADEGLFDPPAGGDLFDPPGELLPEPSADASLSLDDPGLETLEIEGVEDPGLETLEIEGEAPARSLADMAREEERLGPFRLAEPETATGDAALFPMGEASRLPEYPPADVEFYIRLRPTDDAFSGATFRQIDLIGIGRSPDQEVYVEHDLVGASHAEILFSEGRYSIAPVAGNRVSINGEAILQPTVLCRDDLITLVGPGGPAFRVEMLKPDRPPGQKRSRLPLLLRPYAFFAEPLADRLDVSPLLIVLLSNLIAAPLILGLALLIFLALNPTAPAGP